MILLVGDQDWPFPVPLIQEDQRWRFDSGLGSLEIRARRVGANELDAIEICAGYVEAQQAYAAEHRDYARSIRNGLYQPGSPDGSCRKVSPAPQWNRRHAARSPTTVIISVF